MNCLELLQVFLFPQLQWNTLVETDIWHGISSRHAKQNGVSKCRSRMMSWWLIPKVGMALAYRRYWSPLEGSQCIKTPSFPIKSTAFLYFPAGRNWAGKEPTSIWNIGIVSTSRELSNCFKEYYQLQIPSTLVCVPSLCSTLVRMAFSKDQILHALVHMAFSLARSSSVFCSAS